MTRQRALAAVLLVVAFLALVASRAFPFRDDIPDVAQAAIAIAGAACGLAGVGLWLRGTTDSEG
ncbi:hypothetical protein ACH495_00920 [Micromonospora sp. NPDC018662]|uniref:hypothetical protein n=1 Tax=Micromonospora sp. NPDC018662 TaxID=3364238 RepID=UPI0037AA3BE0